MRFEYGPKRFDDAEVKLKSISRDAVRSNTGEIYAVDESWTLTHKLHSDSGADGMVTLMRALERYYSVQGQRATLYTNGGLVAHRFDPALLIQGPQITHFGYPDLSGAAMVNTVDVDVTLTGRHEVVGGYQYLQFEERLDFSGGGPKIVFLGGAIGPPIKQTTRRFTPYVAVQSGVAVGRNGRPSPPPLVFGAANLVEAPRIGKASPSRLARGVYREFSIQWSFTFMSATPLDGEPNLPP